MDGVLCRHQPQDLASPGGRLLLSYCGGPADEGARGSRAEAGTAQVPQGRRPRAICRVNRSMVPWKSPGPVAELVLPRGARRLRASGGISLLDLCIFALPEALRRRVAQSPFCSALSPRQACFFTEGRQESRKRGIFPDQPSLCEAPWVPAIKRSLRYHLSFIIYCLLFVYLDACLEK